VGGWVGGWVDWFWFGQGAAGSGAPVTHPNPRQTRRLPKPLHTLQLPRNPPPKPGPSRRAGRSAAAPLRRPWSAAP
jgi:hypothetical protein